MAMRMNEFYHARRAQLRETGNVESARCACRDRLARALAAIVSCTRQSDRQPRNEIPFAFDHRHAARYFRGKLERAGRRRSPALARFPARAARDRLRIAEKRMGAALPDRAAQARQLAGAMPLYLKAHSYGEYVFDWAWADAYRRHGRRYYPKLLAAIPFTPVSGQRLIAGDARDSPLPARCGARVHGRRGAFVAAYPLPATRGSGGMRRRRTHDAQQRAVPLDQPRLPRFRGFPGDHESRQAHQHTPGAAQAERARHPVHAPDRRGHPRRGLAILLSLLLQHLPGAPLDAVPLAGILRAHRTRCCRTTCSWWSARATA